jgi:tagatose-1,6-bisphosphate aldolase non-catalytic subunit AgaZ/GatZ
VKKLICFSLWGDDKKYLHGALENAELSKRFYPDWRCRYYGTMNQIRSHKEYFDSPLYVKVMWIILLFVI